MLYEPESDSIFMFRSCGSLRERRTVLARHCGKSRVGLDDGQLGGGRHYYGEENVYERHGVNESRNDIRREWCGGRDGR